ESRSLPALFLEGPIVEKRSGLFVVRRPRDCERQFPIQVWALFLSAARCRSRRYGRVGRCRHYFSKARSSKNGRAFLLYGRRAIARDSFPYRYGLCFFQPLAAARGGMGG